MVNERKMINERKRYKKRKKKKRRRRILFGLFILSLLLLASSLGYASFLMHKAESVMNKSYEMLRHDNTKSLDPKKDNFAVLFIGVDDSRSRNFKKDTRSDALILATFNAKDKSVKMVSIPRDSYVYIPCEDKYDKITHAHAYGGVKCTVESVENLFDIHINYYVKMNFYAFMDVVDALGGIEVEVPYDIKEKDSEDHRNAIVLKKGLHKLNGEEALALARTRKKDNDIERGKRQQEILKAILKKASQASSITKYDDVIEAVGSNMKTNFTFDQIKSLVYYVISNKNISIESLHLTGTDHNDGVYYYMLDEQSVQEISETLQNHLR
ncbi:MULTISPECIES: LCP family protein [Parageobacillus]|jgi:polyisoprenyl-teichoic acid--peptidoglycan teichoic acid transferase|uniref:Transcriptional regulator n=1 Tax=Parageobacillus thermoglucosidasius TaxID=1426 RepID=A0A1B7KQQ7_PARTM|nr:MULTISPECIES: LCP family protein [Parageobacillus]OAT72417.1 transcriptional regulator [Parageobacillus thermoglucosidasius]BDG45758.1 transcriptional regulator [Parageobacillus sp. KH3-4]